MFDELPKLKKSKMNNVEIIPGILEQTWAEIEKKLHTIEPFATSVHIDVIDGKFASVTTFLDPEPFRNYTEILLCEVHLMVEEPIEWIERFGKVGFKRFLGHIENMSDQNAFVAKAREYGEGILALDAQTSIHDIAHPQETDGIVVMTVHAGLSGQTIQEPLLQKVMHLKGLHIPLEVDGGMNDRTIVLAKEAGATRCVATSFLFGSENPQTAFQTLTGLVV